MSQHHKALVLAPWYKAPRQRRKLHLAMDVGTDEILVEVLTDQNTSDISQLAALLGQIAASTASFTADGIHDSDETYKAVRCHRPDASVIVPPRMRKFHDTHHVPPDQRDWHTNATAGRGRMGWQAIETAGKGEKTKTCFWFLYVRF